ncbi:hypothetical protein NE236_13055 [Actinoallomurus purpureus]|uniref:hypothetical protein n=1 Tax=Actinoallomurus purpureus TaxID=478114 RepID=UPI0020926DEA|nr:hypothetical protein [Actinoallomurus purpureus]MCO6005914.1 hypothetical protein [Actinoallomurus purpureus]
MRNVAKAALTGLIIAPMLTTALATPGHASTTSPGNGVIPMVVHEGSQQTQQTLCSPKYYCYTFFSNQGFIGRYDLLLVPKKRKQTCITLGDYITVRSLYTGSRGIVSMHAGKGCTGKKSSRRYKAHAKVAKVPAFRMRSFRMG